MKKIIILLLLLTHVNLALAAPLKERVINGTSSSQGKWPWMASLSEVGSDPKQGHSCGGVLINSNHVLTAAHCVVGYMEFPESIQVTLGRTKLSDEIGITVPSAGIILHPDYNPERSSNDIALIRIAETGLTEFIAPVSFADQTAWDAQSNATVIGWGFIDSSFPVRPDNLQQADIPIVDEVSCAERIGIDFEPTSMICAGTLATTQSTGDGVDACYGDSGGPLVVETGQGVKLAGLVSWGFACGSDKYWGVYTKVAQFYEWILSNPQVAPYSKSAPTVRGRPEVNSSLVCQKGEWGGEGEFTYKYQWIDEQEGVIKESSKPSYKLRRTDIGRNLKCSVSASNGTSETALETESTGIIFPLTRSMTAKSAGRSSATKIGMRCEKSQCSMLLSFGNAQVKGVSAVIRGNSVTATGGKSFKGKKVTDDSWTIKLPNSASGSGIIYVRVVYFNRKSQLLEL